MKSKQYDPENHVCWCLKQKRGIQLEATNDNLCAAYIVKAKSALNMLNSAIEKNETDWIATTAYYSRYFALYALLQKCGIKSEIHDCTISLMHHLFVEENILDEKLYKELCLAKELRVDVQYYVTEELDKEKLKTDSKTANLFVLRIEKAIEDINNKQINQIRDKIKKLTYQYHQTNNNIILGLTGTFGAGKGAIAEILKKKGFVQLIMSDVLREECRKAGIEENRDNLLAMGNKLRAEFGSGILMKRLIEKARKERDNKAIIDGLRSIGEAEELKKNSGKLIAVDAPLKLRYERVVKRGTSKDNITFEEFKKQEEKEAEIKKCVENANYKLINDSTLEELNKKVEDILKKLK